jgi:hypothetical protein
MPHSPFGQRVGAAVLIRLARMRRNGLGRSDQREEHGHEHHELAAMEPVEEFAILREDHPTRKLSF